MGVVAREHEKLGAGIVDQISGIFTRKRRELDMPANVLRGFHRERLEQRIGPAEAPVAEIKLAQIPRHPCRPELDHAAAQLAHLAFRLNIEIDKGSLISMAEASKAIEEKKVINLLKTRFRSVPGRFDLGTFDREDEITISEYFESVENCLSAEGLGVANNGLCWLLALTLEMIQQQEWTTFD